MISCVSIFPSTLLRISDDFLFSIFMDVVIGSIFDLRFSIFVFIVLIWHN